MPSKNWGTFDAALRISSQEHGLDLMQPPLCRQIFTLWAQMADFWPLR
jgi:hypothetical protein